MMRSKSETMNSNFVKNYLKDLKGTKMNSIAHLNLKDFNSDQINFILEQAKQRVIDHYLEFTGSVLPQEAWALFQTNHAVIVDVRTYEERKFVGFIENTLHIPWATGTALDRNPNFAEELETQVGKDQLIFLICRSGKRSAAAANVAFNAGLKNVYNIDQGFEGDINEHRQRGTFNGWRFHHLPWIQE